MKTRTTVISNAGFRQALLTLTAVSALCLGGCTQMDMPIYFTGQRAQLVEENHAQTYEVASLSAAHFDEMADHYNRYGSGQAEVIVGYDPRSKKNTAMRATDNLHRISNELSQRGVKNIKGSIQALEGIGDRSEMIIGYTSVMADGPEGCEMMPGYDTTHAEIMPDYQLRCTVETMAARQVAHPEDLAGRTYDTQADGRRTGIAVERYRAGALPPLSGTYSSTSN